MSFYDQVLDTWHKLPVWLSSLIASAAFFIVNAGLQYLLVTDPKVFTFGGLGAALIAGLLNFADSKVRLHQTPPWPDPQPNPRIK